MSNSLTFLVSLAFFAYLLSGVLFLNHVWGYSVLSSGLMMSPAPICAVPVALLSSSLHRRHTRVVVILGSLLIALFGVGALMGLEARSDLPLWLGLGAVLGAGIGATLPLLSAVAVENVGEARFATASALNSTVRQFAAVLAFAVVAAILDDRVPAAITFRPIWTGVGLAGAAAASMGLLSRVGLREEGRAPRILAPAGKETRMGA